MAGEWWVVVGVGIRGEVRAVNVSTPVTPIVSVLIALPREDLHALGLKIERQLEQARERVAFLEFQEQQLAEAIERAKAPT